MQIKTIAKAIEKKLDEWLKTIKDETLRKDVRKNILVSGGCITSMLLNEPVNDYDIYLMDMDVVKRLTQYYIEPLKDKIELFDGRQKQNLVEQAEESYKKEITEINNGRMISLRNLKEDQIKLYFIGSTSGLKANEDVPDAERNYTPMYFSPNAISLSNNIQIVIRFHGNAEQIHKTFDFVHATNYFTFSEGLVRNLPAIESILTKQLKYQGSQYPVTSIVRAKKFTKRNWNINAGEMLKIMFQISQLDLTNPDVLEEQLLGIDVAFFDTLISILRNKANTDTNFKLTSEYINTLIDKVFNESETETNE